MISTLLVTRHDVNTACDKPTPHSIRYHALHANTWEVARGYTREHATRGNTCQHIPARGIPLSPAPQLEQGMPAPKSRRRGTPFGRNRRRSPWPQTPPCCLHARGWSKQARRGTASVPGSNAKQASKQANKQAIKQAIKQSSNQSSKQASNQAINQASKLTSKHLPGHTLLGCLCKLEKVRHPISRERGHLQASRQIRQPGSKQANQATYTVRRETS